MNHQYTSEQCTIAFVCNILETKSNHFQHSLNMRSELDLDEREYNGEVAQLLRFGLVWFCSSTIFMLPQFLTNMNVEEKKI